MILTKPSGYSENTFADLFCVEAVKRNIFSEFSVYIRKVLIIEHVDFIRTFLLYLQKRNDGQNLVPKMGIYLHIKYLRIYAHAAREFTTSKDCLLF